MKHELALLTINGDKEWGWLVCPVCADTSVHPVGVSVLPAGPLIADVMVTASGIHIDKTATPIGRGVLIRLLFGCESGCRFICEFHFHKGGTMSKICDIGQDASPEAWPEVIWRD